jgi:hypothetical protein
MERVHWNWMAVSVIMFVDVPTYRLSYRWDYYIKLCCNQYVPNIALHFCQRLLIVISFLRMILYLNLATYLPYIAKSYFTTL